MTKKSLISLATLLVGLVFARNTEGDSLRINSIGDGSSVGYSSVYLQHSEGSSEGEDDNDIAWVVGPPFTGTKRFRPYTDPYNVDLYEDERPTNSQSRFNIKLTVDEVFGGTITSTNRLKFYILEQDPTRHYTTKINCSEDWTPNGQPFSAQVNIREVIANNSGYVNLPGVLNCSSGTVYGTCEVNPAFNSLTPFKSGAGTGTLSLEEMAIMDYNSNTGIIVNADAGGYIDRLMMGRTDNIGNFSVTTNDFVGEGVTSTNVVFEGIKGSNFIHAVYGLKTPTTHSLRFIDERAGINETNTVNEGSYLGKTIEDYVYPPEQEGVRYRAVKVNTTDVGARTNAP